ncbi:MAG: ribonuclease H-like domain-containing protein [Bacteroidetes bacterium]|nr:ribonuclease H-like domain-containing protein [Bacteroidota bacterium]MBU1113689.1 ribonuclease H-like domain-containing protein [Bacteroidota bacterium]MBU1799092.1 ribonuclease H-like domain-containing protein [Bacteroidota bacterium]
MKLVFDIETVGVEFETLSESQQEFILRYSEKEQGDEQREKLKDEAIRYLSLYPLTAKVVAIGMLNTDTEHSMVLFEEKEHKEWQSEESGVKYCSYSEADMLSHFWEFAKKADSVITFNGRNFDIPFLMMRSAILKIRPSRNFIKKRYDNKSHIDLLEVLTNYGATKKFNLDFYCKSFGIESPKSHGVSGIDVKELYTAGKIEEIATYCAHDVEATYQLYKIWNEYLNI